MASDNKAYVVRGANMRCKFGSHTRKINLPISHGAYVNGEPMMNEEDNKAEDNVPYFGICSSPENKCPETVDLKSEESGSRITGKKCIPEFLAEWINTKEDALVDKKRALTTDSKLICTYLGEVGFINSGQEVEKKEGEQVKEANEEVQEKSRDTQGIALLSQNNQRHKSISGVEIDGGGISTKEENRSDPYKAGIKNFEEYGLVESPINALKYLHYNRNKLNTNIPESVESANMQSWIELEDSKAYFHQLGEGNLDNRKFVSPNGQKEVVFDKEGNIVTDPLNEGTYNVVGPDNFVGHGLFDVVPYIPWGNDVDDPSNALDRIMWLIDAAKDQSKEESLRIKTFKEWLNNLGK